MIRLKLARTRYQQISSIHRASTSPTVELHYPQNKRGLRVMLFYATMTGMQIRGKYSSHRVNNLNRSPSAILAKAKDSSMAWQVRTIMSQNRKSKVRISSGFSFNRHIVHLCSLHGIPWNARMHSESGKSSG
jgi:hypothetical protein